MITIKPVGYSSVIPPGKDMSGVDETDLRYGYFLGDIKFVVNGVNLGTDWGWVPVVDFGLCLHWIVTRLEKEPRQVFDFTESGSEIVFEADGPLVRISAEHTESSVSASMAELRQATSDFVEEVLRLHPGLPDHPAVRRVLSQE